MKLTNTRPISAPTSAWTQYEMILLDGGSTLVTVAVVAAVVDDVWGGCCDDDDDGGTMLGSSPQSALSRLATSES